VDKNQREEPSLSAKKSAATVKGLDSRFLEFGDSGQASNFDRADKPLPSTQIVVAHRRMGESKRVGKWWFGSESAS
jgi:hypothetical protein